tara:strand:+ start:849 stop:1034 length:186 start_codon:yes stop_codon:yes gene_type:complete
LTNILKQNKMGHIKEPKGVDFIIESEPLTEKDRKEISKFIVDYKSAHKKKPRTQKRKKQTT